MSISSCSFEKKQEKKQEILVAVKEVPLNLNLMDSLTIHRIDNFILNNSKYNNLSGAFLFSKGDRTYSNAFGKARHLKSKDVQVNDVFQLASESKLITSLCVLKLVEEGSLKLTDTIHNILQARRRKRDIF